MHGLVHFLDEPWGQLFDLKNDPTEVVNLWESADHQAKKQELPDELREFRIRSGLKTADWAQDWR